MTRVAQLMLVLAAIGLWGASRLTWITLTSFDGLGPPRTTAVSGASWSTALVPFAVLLLAGAVAALAVRGWPLRLLAVLVALVSAGAAYLSITLWTTPDVAPRAAHLADIPVVWLVGCSRAYWGAGLALASAVATLGAAVLLMRVAVKGSSRTQKYSRQTQQRAVDDSEATASERTIWDALDEGSDPTRDPTRDSGTEGR